MFNHRPELVFQDYLWNYDDLYIYLWIMLIQKSHDTISVLKELLQIKKK